jgi:hypothetical protein
MTSVDMKPVIVPFRGVVRGATLRFAWNLTEPNPNDPSVRQPLNLLNVQVVFVVKDSPGELARHIFRIVGENQVPLSDGRVLFSRAAADMRIGNAERRNEWYYEVWVTEPNGDQGVPFAGPFELEPAAKTT